MTAPPAPGSFGELLQQYRSAASLSQKELAMRAGLSQRGISDLERGERLAPRPATVRRLAQALNLHKREQAVLLAATRISTPRGHAMPGGSHPATRSPAASLPPSRSSFIGRQREVDKVVTLLGSARLLTLTGPGGTGKTRVALEAAAAVLGKYADGVFFVGLAPISDPRLVASTISRVMQVAEDGRPPTEALANFLRRKHLLLILDNFEQVLGAALDVADLLAACPRLHVLVTSREPLRLAGEQEFTVPPLEHDESVELFAERARAVNLDFSLTPETASSVSELCRQLDYLPLAIELAAAHARLLDPRSMLARMEPRLPMLTDGPRDAPARQQTLRNTIAWSYNLLDAEEQLLFRSLSVFVGGSTLDAAEAICTRNAGITRERIESLVAKSLLRAAPSAAGAVRVTMLETVREFGLEQLAWMGELEPLRRRHAAYFLAVAEEAEPALGGPDIRTWIDRLESELDNVRAALEWSIAQQKQTAETALRLTGALGRFWWIAGHFAEGRRWLKRTLASDCVPSAPRMKALWAAGWLAHIQRDSRTANALLEESLVLAEQRNDQWWRAWVLHGLGRVAYFDDDAQRAAELGQRSLEIAQKLGDVWLIAWAFHLLGLAAYIAGDYAAATVQYERSLAIRREAGHLEGLFIVLHLKGAAVYRLGRSAEAFALVREALGIARQINSNWFFNCVLPILASIAAEHDPVRAARLGGAVTAMCESTDTLPIPITEALFDEGMQRARRKLGDAAFDSAWAAGHALSQDAALAEAEAIEVVGVQRRPGGLTTMEVEVLRRLARGRSTREIAEELVVAVSTVDRHITHIYDKIGQRGRSAATAFAIEHGLT